MSFAVTIAAVGTGYSIYSSSQQAKAGKKALAQQGDQANLSYGLQQDQLNFFKEAIAAFQEQAMALAGESKGEVKRAYNKSVSYIDAIPEIKDLMPDAEALSREDFDFRTGIKRENLAFILGDNEKSLRDAQTINTDLAALDSANLQNRFGQIVRSQMFDLKASTVGDPLGTFANLSARNLYDFSQQGLSSALAINDFFAKNGTVDPISPLQTSFDLRQVAEKEAALRIDNERYRATTIANINSGLTGALGNALGASSRSSTMGIGIEQDYLSNLFGLSNTSLVNQQNQQNQILSAIGTLGTAIGGYQQTKIQQAALNSQAALNNQLIAQYTTNRLPAGADRYSIQAA